MPVKKNEWGGHVYKKQLMGVFLFLVGFLWYANETNLLGVTVEHFWPDILMLIGAIIFFKALFMKYIKK